MPLTSASRPPRYSLTQHWQQHTLRLTKRRLLQQVPALPSELINTTHCWQMLHQDQDYTVRERGQ